MEEMMLLIALCSVATLLSFVWYRRDVCSSLREDPKMVLFPTLCGAALGLGLSAVVTGFTPVQHTLVDVVEIENKHSADGTRSPLRLEVWQHEFTEDWYWLLTLSWPKQFTYRLSVEVEDAVVLLDL